MHGTGFYRFPARARMKSNDVNTGYGIPSERHAAGLSNRSEV